MFPQRNGLQSLARTLCVLIFQLLLTHFCQGQPQLIGPPQPIIANIGDDIILPCHLEPGQDLVAMTLEWKRSDLKPIFVHARRARQNLLHIQHPAYKERTSIPIDELKRGNISLKLSDVKPSDHGRYECFIPNLNENSFVDLVVASGAVSSPIINLAGIDRNRGGVILNCESKGWYPEPEVFWLDGEGNLLSAGPTETVRGPDDLYTVSSRVTVEKRHYNNFTCRVQQKNISQTRETHFCVPGDFFEVQSSSVVPIIGLAVSLAVCIMFIFSVIFFLCKWRQKIIKTSHRDETNQEETKRTLLKTQENVKMNEGERGKKTKHVSWNPYKWFKDERQERERAEREVESSKKKVETEQTELQQLREEKQRNEKELKEELEKKKKEFEDRLTKVQQELQEEKKRRTGAEKQKKDLEAKIKEVETEQTELQQLCEEKQRNENDLKEELEKKKKEFEDKLTKVQQELQEEKKRRTGAEKQKKDLEAKIKEVEKLTEEKQRLNKELETERKELKHREMLEIVNSQTKSLELDTSSAGQDLVTGHIIVDEVDPEGRYVCLKNKSDEKQQMKDWQLHIQVDDRKPIIYTFDSKFKLNPGQTVTIWSKKSGVTPNYTTDLVSSESWSSGDQLLVTLYSDTGKGVSIRNVQTSSSSVLHSAVHV